MRRILIFLTSIWFCCVYSTAGAEKEIQLAEMQVTAKKRIEEADRKAQEALEMIKTAAELRGAMTNLSHVQENRDSALVKLGPKLESALLSYSAGVAYGDILTLFEILTGREAVYKR